jgi:hypothetical protein
MSHKKRRRTKQVKLRSSQNEPQPRQWKLVIDSKEASVNFFSILSSFQVSGGSGLINKEALKYVTKWMNYILEHDPGVSKRANSSQGPFRKRDMSPLDISLVLNWKERDLMLFIWKMIYSQLISPKGRIAWIENQGREDYEMALKNFKSWIDTLESEGYILEK